MATIKKLDKPNSKIFNEKEFKGKKFPYPSHNMDPSLKGKMYHKEWAEKIYNLYLNKMAWLPGSIYNNIDRLRAWSDGKQDTTEILDWITGKEEAPPEVQAFDRNGYDIREPGGPEKTRKAWVNLDSSPVSVFPKIKTKINEHIRSMYYEMSVNAIDSYSVREESKSKYKLWLYKLNQKWIDTQKALAGINVQQEKFIPENLEELELYAASGGFKVPYAISMEDLLRHTFEISKWDKNVAEKVRGDLMTLGFTMIEEDYDPELKRVVVRYADPKYSGVQYGENGYEDSEYGYKIQWVEISKVRQQLNLDYETAASLAYSYSGMFGNPKENDWTQYGSIHTSDSGNEYLGCDFYKVPVLNFEFIDIDNENYVEYEDKFGKKRTKPYNEDLQDNEILKKWQYRYVRKGKWIVGTEYLWDWGKKEFYPRDNFNKPRIRFRAIRLNTEPILAQVLPFLRGFQLAWTKLQNAIALAIANGMAIDIGSIKNIAIGKGSNNDPMEVLSFFRQTGFLMYKNSTKLSGLSRYQAPPIIPIQNSTYDNIKIQFEAMDYFMNKIEDTGGISMVSTGKAPDPDVAKYNMQVSLQGTNDIINNIARAQTDLQEDVSVNICYRIRTICNRNEKVRKSYESVIGKNRMKAILLAEKNHVDYGIYIEASDITEEKRNIMAMIQASITPTGSGDQGKLSASEGIQILDMVHQRQNFRRIGLILGYWLRRKEIQMHEKQKELIAMQGQYQNQLKLTEAAMKEKEQQFKMAENFQKFRQDYMLKYQEAPEKTVNSNKQ